MTNRQWVILGVITLLGLIGLMLPPKGGEGLTDEQRLEIISFCNENPDSWKCR